MDLLDNIEKSDTFPIKNSSHLTRIIQYFIAEENYLSSVYSKVLDSLKERDKPEDKEIIARLQYLYNDTLRHTGSLMECLTSLDSNITSQYEKGITGKE